MILYQYRRIYSNNEFSYFKSLIKSGQIKFSDPSTFNDPFDFCPNALPDVPEGAFPHAVGHYANRVRRSVDARLHGVLCLSRRSNNMLMWSHYAEQHRGLCIGFDTNLLLKFAPRNCDGYPLYEKINKVIYTKLRPGRGDPALFYTKAKEWCYEQEYRVVSSIKKGEPSWGPGVWQIPKNAIKEIIFGAEMDQECEKEIVKFLKGIEARFNLKKAVLNMHQYKIEIEPLEGQPKIASRVGSVLAPNGEWLTI